ncbi:CheY-like superfamily [Mycena olivaceomarginata]|nr:CheY-like superfamily [Mycena olivaceomarginata]
MVHGTEEFPYRTLGGFDFAGFDGLQVKLQGNAIPDNSLSISIDNTPRDILGANPANLGEVDLEKEVVLPTPTSPKYLGCTVFTHGQSGFINNGLEMLTVRHLMPRGTGETDRGSYEGGNLVGNQEPSGNSAQTLRVRRGWAVRPRVLLVDDDAVTHKLTSTLLRIFGCTTDIAVDGVGAVNQMNIEKYDLVLMDIVMPEMDGISAKLMIRKFDPQTPIISMTSGSQLAEIMTYFSSGMNDILPKPFTRDGLPEVLEKHLAHLMVIKQQMAMQMIPSPPTAPPPNEEGFANAFRGGAVSLPHSTLNYSLSGGGGTNLLVGMGVTNKDGSVDGEDGDERGGKRSRFKV